MTLALLWAVSSASAATAAPAIMYMNFEDAPYDGTPDEVIDSSGNNHHGRMIAGVTLDDTSPAIAGGSGTCGYASFSDGKIEVTGLPVSTAADDKTTVAFWMRWDGSNSVMPVGWDRHDIWIFQNSMGFNTSQGDIYGIDASGLANRWVHVVAEFTNFDITENRLWIDGVEQTLTQRRGSPRNSRAVVDPTLSIGGWGANSNYRFEGDLDEYKLFNGTLSSTEITDLTTETHACGGVLLDVRMEEQNWTGAAGDVINDGSSGADGQSYGGVLTAGSTPAVAGTPGTCRYGDFDGVDDYLEFDDRAELDLADVLTLAAWIYPRAYNPGGLSSFISKDTNYEVHLNDAGYLNWWWQSSTGTHEFNSTAIVPLNEWHHVAFRYTSGSQTMFIDGVARGSASFTGTLDENALPLQIGQDQEFAGRFFYGYIDEVQLLGSAVSDAEIVSIMNTTRPCAGTPVADWRMDEENWDGTPDEVLDYSGNDYHGRSINVTTRDGLLCNAADLRAAGTSDYLILEDTPFDGLDDFTTMLWYRGSESDVITMISAANGSQPNEYLFWFLNHTQFWPWLNNGRVGNIETVSNFGDGNWHFFAWRREGNQSCLYIDATLQGCETATTATLNLSPGSIFVGQEQDSFGGGFESSQGNEGEIDELLVFDSALSETAILTIRSNHLAGNNWDGSPRSCPSAGAAAFLITHDNQGIHCLQEPMTVTAVDGGGATATGYAEAVTLTTGSGCGTWSLDSGTPANFDDATADDGVATYTFDPSDGGVATFFLSYEEGPAVLDIDVYQTNDTSIRDDETEGTLTFAPDGFTITNSALGNPPPDPIVDPITTKTAGTDFDMHIAAYGQTATDPECGVIETYTGNRELKFYMDYDNPGTGSRFATIDDQTITGTLATATSQTVSFAAGQAVVTAKYKDAGEISLNVADDDTYAHTLTGSSNPFVSKPAALVVSRVATTGGTLNPGAVTVLDDRFVPAGEPFVVDIEARDAENARTPNFGAETPAETVRVQSDALVLPTVGRNGSTGDVIGGAGFVASGVGGRLTNAAVIFDEVGVIQLRPELVSSDYLGAGDITSTVSGNVGRFYPASYALASSSVTAACTTYTYMDQNELSVQFRLEARNTGNDVVENYDRVRLNEAAAVAAVTTVAENDDDGVDRSARLNVAGATWTLGAYAVTDTAARFTRGGGHRRAVRYAAVRGRGQRRARPGCARRAGHECGHKRRLHDTGKLQRARHRRRHPRGLWTVDGVARIRTRDPQPQRAARSTGVHGCRFRAASCGCLLELREWWCRSRRLYRESGRRGYGSVRAGCRRQRHGGA